MTDTQNNHFKLSASPSQEEQVRKWENKVKNHFSSSDHLQNYLFETMNHFYYRYLSTSQDEELITKALSGGRWGAVSYEDKMIEALKISNVKAKKGIIELAKSVPLGKGVCVQYSLWVEIQKMTSENGSLTFTSQISWDYPNFESETKRDYRQVHFSYSDLAEFRKQLGIKLEEVCEIF